MRVKTISGNNFLKNILLSLSVVLLLQQNVWAQSAEKVELAGIVQTADGETLPGVNLVLNPGNKGVTTDINGEFTFQNISSGTYKLQVSCIGFQSLNREVQVKDEKSPALQLVLVPENYMINDVVVSGKSATRRVIEQAYQVSSVSTKELFNSTSDAKSVLDRIPGVRIQEEGGLGSDLSFTLNGFSGDQVKFFMDGIPMDNAGSMTLGDLPVNMIERIDVYKGVVPVWLGTDALGGAVNIITNRTNNYLDASYAYGSFNTHRASLNGAYTNEETGFTFRGNLFYNYSDNHYKVWARIVENNTVVDTAWVRRFHDRYRSGSLKLETGLVDKSFADQLLLGFMLSANDKQVQHGATMNTVYGGIVRNSQSVMPTLRYNKKDLLTEGLDVSLYSALNRSRSEVIDTLQGVRYNWLGEQSIIYTSNGERSTDGEFYRTFTTLDETDFNTQLNAGYALSTRSSLALNYSLNYFHRKAHDTEHPDEPANRFPKDLTKQVLGLAYKFDLNNKWSTTLFGKMYHIHAATSKLFDFAMETQRVEAVDNKQFNFGYGLATSYFVMPELQLKFSYEHTARMPMPEEIFGDGLFVEANPDLGPEQSDNINLGAAFSTQKLGNHHLSVGSSLIYREAKDLIYTVVTVSSPQTRYDNLSDTRVLGVEGNLQYAWKDVFHAGANVTYQDITDRAKLIYNESYTGSGWQTNYHYGFRLPNKPYLFANFNAGATAKNVLVDGSTLNVNYFVNFVEKYFLTWTELGAGSDKYIIPRQVSHDIELSYSLQNGKYNIAAECRNLFNEKLYDKYYLQKPGRSFSIKLRYTI
ncbi:TonB-dependent receptor [Draconibacterium sediminis]|uniref:TonB-dependent receptor n=1 Tax=Draconibacterium sediminis TaxID=1544798 RepID=UPI0009E3A70D|nr:TonB-dependent receptor [Draconibacterium sediminis]